MVGKDVASCDVWVAPAEHHAALYTRTAVLHTPSFIAGIAPSQLSDTGQLTCSLASRYPLQLKTDSQPEALRRIINELCQAAQ